MTRKAAQPKEVDNDAFKSIFGLVWPWPPDPQSWSFHVLAPWTMIKIGRSLSKYRVHKFGNRRTNGQTTWEHLVWRWHKKPRYLRAFKVQHDYIDFCIIFLQQNYNIL